MGVQFTPSVQRRLELLDHFATMDKSGQMHLSEYAVIINELLRRGPCNVLMFSCGRDSDGWVRVNKGGKVCCACGRNASRGGVCAATCSA